MDHRSPFNDSLIASGSDDGKVRMVEIYGSGIMLIGAGFHIQGARRFYTANRGGRIAQRCSASEEAHRAFKVLTASPPYERKAVPDHRIEKLAMFCSTRQPRTSSRPHQAIIL